MKKTKRIVSMLLVIACIVCCSTSALGVNSYMGLWEHVPDGEPHVFGDRVYVYGSHDVFESRMCGPNYVVWSAPVDDLTNWKYEGISFDGGESGYLLAPDACQGPDGKYYIYAFGDCDQGGSGATFVAVSDKPEGPFEYLGPIMLNGKSAMIFDPAVLVDDDGSVYLFGGSSNIYKLDPTDMRTVIEGPYQVQEVDNKGNLVQIRNFQEGSSMRKVGDWYVFVYASKYDLDTNHFAYNTNNTNYYNGTLEYAYSKDVYGPYVYGGTIIDNGGETLHPSPGTITKTNYTGNTHGGIELINDEWYVFYHRQTNDCQTYRQAMCEPINLTYDDEGVYIEQAEMTSQGAEKDGLKPNKEYSAGYACYLTKSAYINTDVEMYDTLTPVVNIRNGATVGFKYFNFADEEYTLSVKVKSLGVDGKIAVVLDDPENDPVAVFDVAGSDAGMYITLTESLGKLSGKHAVFFNFYAISQHVAFEFASFEFEAVCKGGNDCPSDGFEDMPAPDHWAHSAIDWAVDAGITNGTSATTFSPDKVCTRAEVVTFLWRSAGKPKAANTKNPFTDVVTGSYYYDAMLWAVEQGITTGTGGTSFSPDRTCTRAEIVTFLWRFEDEAAPENPETPFTDLKADAYYETAVAWAIEQGITTGTGGTAFSPDRTCTRAEVVTFLYRLLEN